MYGSEKGSAAVAGAETHSADEPRSSLDELTAQATAQYAQKDYSGAAELYSRATELQAQTNGELSPLNADLLFCYGRCLYQVALQSSDILGSRVAQEATQEKNQSRSNGKLGVIGSNENVDATNRGPAKDPTHRPLSAATNLHFLGEDDSDGLHDDDDDDEADGAEAMGEEDEFSNAFEILDLARILLLKRLENVPSSSDPSDRNLQRRLQERLADTYDLQAEISLEGERFTDAAKDLKAALELKASLYPSHSNIVAETHYKLSLALEFASVPSQQAQKEPGHVTGQEGVDETLRTEAAKHMQAAIESCEHRIRREKEKAANAGASDAKEAFKSIEEVKDMVQEMQQRLVELQGPFVSPTTAELEGGATDEAAIRGIFATMLDKSPEARQARLKEATDKAKDLTSLVKRKATEARDQDANEALVQGSKRKAGSSDQAPAIKKARSDAGGLDKHDT